MRRPTTDATKRSCRPSSRLNASSGAAANASAPCPSANHRSCGPGAATARYRIAPSRRTRQPCTARGSAVTAAITVPSRSRSRTGPGPRGAGRAGRPAAGRRRAAGNQRRHRVVVHGHRQAPRRADDRAPRVPPGAGTELPERVPPEQVDLAREPDQHLAVGGGPAGRVRSTSTRPTCCSSALTRWLTADGVTCRRAAAASKLPSCDHGREGAELVRVERHMNDANGSSES